MQPVVPAELGLPCIRPGSKAPTVGLTVGAENRIDELEWDDHQFIFVTATCLVEMEAQCRAKLFFVLPNSHAFAGIRSKK